MTGVEQKLSVDSSAIDNLMDSDSDLDMFNSEIFFHLSPKGITSSEFKEANMNPDPE